MLRYILACTDCVTQFFLIKHLNLAIVKIKQRKLRVCMGTEDMLNKGSKNIYGYSLGLTVYVANSLA